MGPSALVLGFLVVLPLILLVYFGLLSGPGVDGPITGAEWRGIVSDPAFYGRLLARSLILGLAAAAITIAIGWPTAWALSRHAVRVRSLYLALIIIPHLTSSLLLIYAMYVLLQPGGPLMAALGATGVADASDTILFTRWAVLIMLAYLFLPFMVMALYASVERIDSTMLLAARSLGANGWQRFWHIVFPVTLPGIMAGLVIVFTPAAGSFVEAQILGGTDGMMFGTVISEQVSRVNNQPRAAAMSIILLVSILLLLAALRAAGQRSFPGAMRRERTR
ncbi:ABC transporter permease [Egibacter rhizosphaerae]|uniref:ABC transporter permease n=1 Tax=Egibacter rhizosphaerae TaxID=1670831 RepID=A0A411YE12_9ACTN|nr:ABC transporter permease [Egibacter rhizosphaerae]QBI19483.1 ABC transporter permease [Egibacter rhizosphaerae]